jgi:delta 1-pyrroline-5-carboxylate dehydrogenase
MCQVSLAQDAGLYRPSDADALRVSEAKASRRNIEASLKDYLVVFDSGRDSDHPRLGLPLASFGDGRVNLAYDLSARHVMAQWTLAQTSAYGKKVNYRAYLGESGVVNLTMSTRF